MSVFPERRPDPIKEILLDSCPFTQITLHSRLREVNYNAWKRKQNEELSNLKKRADLFTETRWREDVIHTLSLTTSEALRNGMDIARRDLAVEIMFLVGFETELAGTGSWTYVFGDLMTQLRSLGFLDQKSRIINRGKTEEACANVVKSGVYWSSIASSLKRDASVQVPSPFVNFLSSSLT